ncbi:MAG: MoxR family ATPase [Lachnospiraceae bacterium]|nr:MoxR family ATPase [Lachnospiraceae bacterium]
MTNAIEELKKAINDNFVGKQEVVENLLICLLAGGHVLLEDVPGVGKTTLARTLAKAVDLSFGRIQFTPDTLPSDVTGVSVLNMKTGEFEYREGAIMRQLILADEINRTSPKTQAALLEAMAEGHVTVDDREIRLPEPFMVVATQNPVEFVGTYPLPEAQLDRFMMKLSVGYPEAADEIRMTRRFLEGRTSDTVESVLNAEGLRKMKEETRAVNVSDAILTYADEIVNLTRKESRFVLGVSPRAMIQMVCAAQAKSVLAGRDYVIPDDIKAIAVNTLHHRVSLTYEARVAGAKVDDVIYENVLKARIPMV